MSKKYVSKILIIFLLITIICPNIYASEIEEEKERVIDELLGEEGMEIIPSLDKETITRAEMVDILINFTNVENDIIYRNIRDTSFGNKLFNNFLDWSLEEEKKINVMKLFEAGIIEGCEQNIFEPERECTYAEAITFIVRSLGWKFLCDSRYGGFPNGYIEMAQQLQIIENPIELELEDTRIQRRLREIIFRSLFVETLMRDTEKFDANYLKTGSAILQRYYDLEYKIGYARKTSEGIEIEKKDYKGNVINKPEFEEGNVLCIYEENEETNIREIRACVEISEEGRAYFSNLIKTLEEVHIE